MNLIDTDCVVKAFKILQEYVDGRHIHLLEATIDNQNDFGMQQFLLGSVSESKINHRKVTGYIKDIIRWFENPDRDKSFSINFDKYE